MSFRLFFFWVCHCNILGLFFLIWIWVLLVIVSFDLDFISFRHEILVLFGSICDWLKLGCII